MSVLVNGTWGFRHQPVEPKAARLMAEEAVASARANAVLATGKVALADADRVIATRNNSVSDAN